MTYISAVVSVLSMVNVQTAIERICAFASIKVRSFFDKIGLIVIVHHIGLNTRL